VKGRTAVINFMFTKCEGFCPITIPHLIDAQRLLAARIGRDIFLDSITLDPAVDTPSALADYKKMMGVGARLDVSHWNRKRHHAPSPPARRLQPGCGDRSAPHSAQRDCGLW
jgi:protein SCO1/2